MDYLDIGISNDQTKMESDMLQKGDGFGYNHPVIGFSAV
jgi:hypothetical protein